MKIIKYFLVVIFILMSSYQVVYADEETPTPTITPQITQTPYSQYTTTATSIYQDAGDFCPIFTPDDLTNLEWWAKCSDCIEGTATITPTLNLTFTPTSTVGNEYWIKWFNVNQTITSGINWGFNYITIDGINVNIPNNTIVAYVYDFTLSGGLAHKPSTNGADEIIRTTSTMGDSNGPGQWLNCYDDTASPDQCALFDFRYLTTNMQTITKTNTKQVSGWASSNSTSQQVTWNRLGFIFYGTKEIITPTAEPSPTPECVDPIITIDGQSGVHGASSALTEDGEIWEEYGTENIGWVDFNINATDVSIIIFNSGKENYLPIYLETELQVYDLEGALITQCRRDTGCTGGMSLTCDLFGSYCDLEFGSTEREISKVRVILNDFSYVHIDYIRSPGSCALSNDTLCMYPESGISAPVLSYTGISYVSTECLVLLPESINFDFINNLVPSGQELIPDIFIVSGGVNLCFKLYDLPAVSLLGISISVSYFLVGALGIMIIKIILRWIGY